MFNSQRKRPGVESQMSSGFNPCLLVKDVFKFNEVFISLQPWTEASAEFTECCMTVLVVNELTRDVFFAVFRCEEGLVGPCSLVGEEEDLAVENPLDAGQVRHPGRRQATLHTAAQTPAPSAAQHEAHEGQGQLLRPRLQGRL